MYKISVNERFLTIGKGKRKQAINLPYESLETLRYALDILYHTQVKSVHIFTHEKKRFRKNLKK